MYNSFEVIIDILFPIKVPSFLNVGNFESLFGSELHESVLIAFCFYVFMQYGLPMPIGLLRADNNLPSWRPDLKEVSLGRFFILATCSMCFLCYFYPCLYFITKVSIDLLRNYDLSVILLLKVENILYHLGLGPKI